jgi:hypothetical protein
VEKTAGAIVLIIELIEVIGRILHKTPEIPLTEILNLVFLVFVYVELDKGFRKRYTLSDSDPRKVARILRIWRYSEGHQQEKMNDLVSASNRLIGQLRNVSYFILATAVLYFLFLVKFAIEGEDDKYHIFHLLFDLVSYVGAFYLLRCFCVMFLPTIVKGQDILSKKTNPYIWLGVGLMVTDVCLTIFVHESSETAQGGLFAQYICGIVQTTHDRATGVFVAEFICGLVNAVVFVLFIARFENKMLEIPPYILFMLYSYAVLQTCLPFVTNNGLVFSKEFSEAFSSIIFKLVLVGKVALAAVMFYVLSSGRIFYYFMSLKSIYDEEEEERNWEKFEEVIVIFAEEPEPFEIIYKLDQKSQTYVAMINPTDLFGHVSGSGKTPAEARAELRKKLSDVAEK